MNELNLIYQHMLESWNGTFNSEFQLFLNMGGEQHPVKVDQKKVFLATADNMNGVTIGKAFFHPACESIMSKETEIFKVIRKLTCAKIYSTFQPIAQVLFSVAGKKSGKTLTARMQEQLAPFKTATNELRTEAMEVIKGIGIVLEGTGIDNRLITWNVTKGGKDQDGRHIYYTASPTFPFYNELVRFLMKNEHATAGTRLTFNNTAATKEAYELVIHLLEMVFPCVVDTESANCYVTSPEAARLQAYLNSYIVVARGMNSLIGKFRKDFDSVGIYGIEVGWASDLERLGELKGLLPTLDYNNHQITRSGEPAPNTESNVRLQGLLNTESVVIQNYQQPSYQQNYQQQGVVSQPATMPVKPSPKGNESYLGCRYLDHNGLFEYRYRQDTGLERVVVYSEDGRLISETIRPPQVQNVMGTGMFNGMGVTVPGYDAATMMTLAMVQNQLKAGIPPIGMTMGNGQYTIDPYTRAPVMVNTQQPQQNNNSWGPTYPTPSTSSVTGMDLSINNL
jgi:hypothetical protein